MKQFCLVSLILVSFVSALSAHFAERTVAYEVDGVRFESVLTWDGDSDAARPGILMVPNWMGPTQASLEKAQKVAAAGYVVMMVDMYGVDVRPQNGSEAGAAAGVLRGDRELMRARGLAALEQFLAAEDIPLNTEQVAAIGFCFGGGTILELARAGAELDAVVSFHGDLLSPTLVGDSGNIQAKVLVLHGADDPFVPQDHVSAFIEAMRTTDADWQLVQFSGTVHSFTDPSAKMSGQAEYNPTSAKRAFAMMKALFDEIW
jgi:dienelactone hydrolase